MSYLETAKGSLAAIRDRPIPPAGTEQPKSSAVPDPDQVARMSLEDFARAGLIVRVYSGGLGCHVLFVSDDISEVDLKDRELPVFRAHDLRKIATLRPTLAALRSFTEVRRVFGADAQLEDIQRLSNNTDSDQHSTSRQA